MCFDVEKPGRRPTNITPVKRNPMHACMSCKQTWQCMGPLPSGVCKCWQQMVRLSLTELKLVYFCRRLCLSAWRTDQDYAL